MPVEFRPQLKAINIASEDLTKITLEVKNRSLDGKYDELRKLSGKTVYLTIVPESYQYQIPFNKATNIPQEKYVVKPDGTVEFIKQEQMSLDLEDGAADIELMTFVVDRETIDEFICEAKSLEFPGVINPREVLFAIDSGEKFIDIANRYELTELQLTNELEQARERYAPYADAWSKKKKKDGGIVLKEDDEEQSKDNEIN